MKLVKNVSLALASAGFMVLAATAEAKAINLTYENSIGSPGFGPGELFVPQGVAQSNADGNVYVSNGRGFDPSPGGAGFLPNVGNRVDVFSPDGTYLKAIGTGVQGKGAGIDEPGDLKFDPISGNLYVADVFNSEIDVYNPQNGEFVTSFGSFSGQGPGDIFFGPGGIDFDKEGNLHVTDFSADEVKVYGRDGSLVKTYGSLGTEPGQFDGPAGLAISQNTGNIYINDQFNNRIQVLDSEENFLYAFGTEGTEPGQFNEPIGIDVDEFDNIYVADSQNNRVQVFDKDGNFLTVFGEPVENPGPPAPGELPFSTNPADLEPGKFNWSGGLSYNDGKVFVGDFFTGRVQVLNVEGRDAAKKVPEPTTLLGLGVFALGAAATKLKKNKQSA
ncbi:scytonemin biosynthesis PEP-CTERM protein ScyF [Calothrix sp. CCY 0018]|uniref:scytonemin biosynthesis PEP-CTERM protein ScyF n=1 Tax=Calothrix sp. CCY 0018 TaxID=3103864 RepID=UPI0039C6F9D6